MTNAESFAINTLCRYLLGAAAHASTPTPTPTDDEVRDALAYLAERSHRNLHAGYHRGSVERLWPSRPRREP